MKTRKNLMVLVLLSLFLSVGVADSAVNFEQYKTTMLTKDREINQTALNNFFSNGGEKILNKYFDDIPDGEEPDEIPNALYDILDSKDKDSGVSKEEAMEGLKLALLGDKAEIVPDITEEDMRKIKEGKKRILQLEEETKNIKEETKNIKEETKNIKEETKNIKEETKNIKEETKNLQSIGNTFKEINEAINAK